VSARKAHEGRAVRTALSGRPETRERRKRIRPATSRCVFQILKRHFSRYTPETVADLRCSRTVPRGRGGVVRELRTRADGRDRLLRRLDAAHRRRAVHPHSSDHPATARNIGRPGADHGSATRVDPGLDGHGDAVQHPSGYMPMPHGKARARSRSISRTTGHRPAAGRFPDVFHQPAEGVLRRKCDEGERLLLRPPARSTRHGRTSRLSTCWRER